MVKSGSFAQISFNIKFYHLPEYLYGASTGGSCHTPVAMAKHTSLDLTSYIVQYRDW